MKWQWTVNYCFFGGVTKWVVICIHSSYTKQYLIWAEMCDAEAPWQTVSTKHVGQCCAQILQALQGIKSVAVLIKWKAFQNVPVIFPLRKMINQQQRRETARCHGEPQQDWAAGVCVSVCVHTKRLRLCQFQPESPPWCPLLSVTPCVCVCVHAEQRVFCGFLCVRSSKLCSRLPDDDLFSRVNFNICNH